MRISPGILTIAEAQSLTAALAEVEKLRRQVELLTQRDKEIIPAKLTGVSGTGSGSGSGTEDDVTLYAWKEQTFDKYGVRYDRPNGLFGSATYMPAREPNESDIASFPLQCFLRRSIVTAGKGPEYEIVAAGGGSTGLQVLDTEHLSYSTIDNTFSAGGQASGTLYTLTSGLWFITGFFEVIYDIGTGGITSLAVGGGGGDIAYFDSIPQMALTGTDYASRYISGFLIINSATQAITASVQGPGVGATGSFQGWSWAIKLGEVA